MSFLESLARPSAMGLLVTGVAALLTVGSCMSVESHVEAAAEGALESAGLDSVEIVDVSYRDVRLDGDESDREAAIGSVEALEDTRSVRWAGTPTIATPTTAATVTTTAPVSTTTTAEPNQQILARIDNRTLTLSGTVPDETTRAGVIAVTSEVYGDAVDADLDVQSVESESHLLRAADDFATLVAALADTMTTAEISLDGTEISVTGVATGREAGPAIADAIQSLSTEVATDISLPEVTAEDAVDEVAETLELEGITFESGSADITDAGLAVIDRITEPLREAFAADPDVRIQVGGHTDSVGDAAFNLTLSQSRAEAVVAALTERGFDADRFDAVGFGETEPIADEATEDGQAQNRRIEFTIVEG